MRKTNHKKLTPPKLCTPNYEMKKYGWFEYSENPRVITNYMTGQKLTVLSGDICATNFEALCEYSDSEINQTLHVNMRRHQKGGVIELDYRRIFTDTPEYAHWIRLDDFLTDVLLCWPEFESTFLKVTGGWQRSIWQPDYRRDYSCRKVDPEHLEEYPISTPYLIPLNTEAPRAWCYFDHENPAPKAELIVQHHGPLNVPYIGSLDSVEGFQGVVPYLEREDKKAYLFPAELEVRPGRDQVPMTFVWYTYVDEQIFFTFRTAASPCFHLELSYCKSYGYRQLPPDDQLRPVSPMGKPVLDDDPRSTNKPFPRANYIPCQVWRRVLPVICDAWPMWTKPPRRFDADMSRFVGQTAFVGNFGPTIMYGYCAGMANSSYTLRFPDS